ncbi:MAG: cupin domain-containing protein [Anaerolineales bacterium]
MPELQEGTVGSRIRELRSRQNLSMRALAEASGLSTNAISKIERSETSPTVSSLRMIANALEVPITTLFTDEKEEKAVFVDGDQRPRLQIVGAIIENLGGGFPDKSLEPFLMTLDPEVGTTADTFTHSGQEFVFCMQGEIEYRVGDRLYQMTSGDSLLFNPSLPHAFRNTGRNPATMLIIIQETDPDNLRQAQAAHASL